MVHFFACHFDPPFGVSIGDCAGGCVFPRAIACKLHHVGITVRCANELVEGDWIDCAACFGDSFLNSDAYLIVGNPIEMVEAGASQKSHRVLVKEPGYLLR